MASTQNASKSHKEETPLPMYLFNFICKDFSFVFVALKILVYVTKSFRFYLYIIRCKTAKDSLFYSVLYKCLILNTLRLFLFRLCLNRIKR